MTAHLINAIFLLMIVLLHPQRPLTLRVGNHSGFVFTCASMWAMMDEVCHCPAASQCLSL